MIIDSLRDYFLDCPILDEFRKINVDYMEVNELAYSIIPTPSDPIVKEYADGGKLKQYQFSIASREFYGDDTLNNLNSVGFYERLQDWIEVQNYENNLPMLGAGKYSQELQVLSSGYLFHAEEDKAQYQIQLRLIYYEGGF